MRAFHGPERQTGSMPTLYFRGPGEPGGDDDSFNEWVDGIMRRWIVVSPDAPAECVDDYPVKIDLADLPDYLWPIPEQEFNEAWLRHCSGAH